MKMKIIFKHPIDTGRKLNLHKTFRRRPGRLLNLYMYIQFTSCVYGEHILIDQWHTQLSLPETFNLSFLKLRSEKQKWRHDSEPWKLDAT